MALQCNVLTLTFLNTYALFNRLSPLSGVWNANTQNRWRSTILVFGHFPPASCSPPLSASKICKLSPINQIPYRKLDAREAFPSDLPKALHTFRYAPLLARKFFSSLPGLKEICRNYINPWTSCWHECASFSLFIDSSSKTSLKITDYLTITCIHLSFILFVFTLE